MISSFLFPEYAGAPFGGSEAFPPAFADADTLRTAVDFGVSAAFSASYALNCGARAGVDLKPAGRFAEDFFYAVPKYRIFRKCEDFEVRFYGCFFTF